MEPIIQYVAEYGDKVRLGNLTPFSDFSGSPVDPDIVKIGFAIDGGEPVVFQYDNTAETPTTDDMVTRTDTGMYHIDIFTSDYAAGVWTCSIMGYPVTDGLDTSMVSSRGNWQMVVNAEPFEM